MENMTIGESLRLIEKIGDGGFGVIYRGLFEKTQQEVAIKLEPAEKEPSHLLKEAKIYQELLNNPLAIGNGITNVYFFKTKTIKNVGEYNIMVMDLQGPSLKELFRKCGEKLSLKTVLMLADQMLQCIEYFHRCSFVHRDLKPNNFLMGTGKSAHKVYIIDFGLAKKFKEKSKHIPYKEGVGLKGTERYVSINANCEIEQSRRDDLESLGYVLIYLLKGSLPWQKSDMILELKISISVDKLCEGLPQEFITYLKYVTNLKFEENPNYQYLRTLFKELFFKSGFKWDYIYDWTQVEQNTSLEEKQPVDFQKEEQQHSQ